MTQAIRFDLIAGVDKWNRGFRDAERTSSRFGARLRVGIATGAAAAAAGVGALAIGAFKLGESFDSAYDTIRVTTGKTGKSLGGLKKDFKAVVQDVPTDFESAATAVGKLNQRTGQTGKGLQRLAEQELELSRITKTDLGENIAASTRLFRDWSIPTRKQASTLDEMFRAAQATGIGVTDLMEKVVQFGSPLRQLGFNLDQTTALFGEFERAGVVTETVLPGLKMALKNYALAHKDPQKALIETIRRIKESSSAADANSIAFKTFGARAGPDLAAAIREGHFDLDALIKTIAGGKDTIRGAAADTADFSEKWKVFSNRMKVLAEPAVSALFTAISTLAEPALKGISDFMTNTVIPGLKILKQWFDDNKTSIGYLATALKDSFLPAADAATTSTDDLRTSGQKLGDQLIDVAIFAANLVKWWIDTRIQTVELMKATYNLIIGLGYAANAVDKLTGGTGHVADAMVRFGREGKKVAEGDLVKLKQSSKNTQAQLDKMHGRKLDIEGRDKVGPVARRIREELAALTGVLPGQVLRSTVRGGVRREAKGGYITGPGGPTGDRIPALLSSGEFVVNAAAVKNIGVENMKRLNAMRFAGGGLVDEVSALPALRTRMLAFGRKLFGGSAGIKAFIRHADALPYIWGGVGPGGYDCSGLTGAVYALIKHLNPYHRYFTTQSNFTALGFKPGSGGIYQIGVNRGHGHMVGRYGGLPFEAESTRTGIKVGSAATSVSSMPQIYHMAKGGLVDLKELLRAGVAIGGDPGKLRIERFDRGGMLLPGHLGYNGTGRAEPVGLDEDRLARKIAAALVEALRASPPRVAVDDIHTGLLRKKNARTGGMSLGLS
jgi:hypothetical protein